MIRGERRQSRRVGLDGWRLFTKQVQTTGMSAVAAVQISSSGYFWILLVLPKLSRLAFIRTTLQHNKWKWLKWAALING